MMSEMDLKLERLESELYAQKETAKLFRAVVSDNHVVAQQMKLEQEFLQKQLKKADRALGITTAWALLTTVALGVSVLLHIYGWSG